MSWVLVGWVCMQLHGMQWGCLISETLCIDSDLISQLMKNQLLAISRIKPNICLLWFPNRFQYCLWKIDPGRKDFFWWNPGWNSSWESFCSTLCAQTRFELCCPSLWFSCKGWVTVSETSWVREKWSEEEQVQRELSWRARWKCHSDTSQEKREPVWPKSAAHPLHLMKPKSSSLTHQMNIQEMNLPCESLNLSHSMSQWQENHLVLRCRRLSPYSFESSLYQHSKSRAVQLCFYP